MNVYRRQLKKFLTPLVLRDVNNSISDKTIYVNVLLLCKNEFWQRIFYPEEYGFKVEDSYIFEYDSSIHSLDTILVMFDVIHFLDDNSACIDDFPVTRDIHEDIEIAFLLRDYADTCSYIRWNRYNNLDIPLSEEQPDADTYNQWVMDHVEFKRYPDIGLDNPLFDICRVIKVEGEDTYHIIDYTTLSTNELWDDICLSLENGEFVDIISYCTIITSKQHYIFKEKLAYKIHKNIEEFLLANKVLIYKLIALDYHKTYLNKDGITYLKSLLSK